MAIHWLGGISADFNNALNWNPNQIPGGADDAVIDAVGFSPISTQNNTVNTLAVVVGATFTIAGSAGTTFTVNNGSGPGDLAGNVVISNGVNLSIGGSIVNSGTISESSSGTTTQIKLNQTTNTLTGGGKVILSANTNNLIQATTSTFLLDNQDNTISGGGNIGNGAMVLSNEGIINANESTASLTVNTGSNIIANSGTMEATAGGDLFILSPVNNVGGTIEAVGAGSIVFLQANVTGGTVLASGGGQIQTSGGSGVLDGLGLHPVTNGSAIQVLNGQSLTLLGTIINNSSINLNATANVTSLKIGSPIVTLKGTGAIHLTNNANNQIIGNSSAFQLVNLTNTIDGAGLLGAGQMTFFNDGTVNANQPGSLTLGTGANGTTNTGVMQATNTGGLVIFNTAVNNNSGTIQALVAGSKVDLDGGTIRGGTLKSANGGIIETRAGSSGGLDGITFGTLANSGTVQVNDQTRLDIAGTINNTGTIKLNQTSGTNAATLRITSQNATLTGGGKVVMSNNSLNQIVGLNSAFTLTNVNNVISGAGQIGTSATMTLVNQAAGVINANQTTSIVVRTDANTIINAGTMESTNTVGGNGGLVIWNTAVNNTGGTIMAVGANSHVDLQSATIEGGTLTTSSGGVIKAIDTGSSLDGITFGALNNKGTIQILNQMRLSLAGVINNTGAINENQTANSGSTQIRINSQNVTLKGGGDVVMSDNSLNQIVGTNGSFTLTNVDNTISGAGQIGTSATMSLVNKTAGLINANGSNALTVRTDANIITNAGTMEGTGTGGLVIWNTTVNNAGGTIMAVGAGSHVDLQTAYIEGGILTTSGGGVIQTVDTGSALDGITSGVLNNKGTIRVQDSTRLGLVGTINNTGTINETSSGAVAALRIIGNTTLQGAGKVVMTDNVNNQIFGTNANFQLVNVDNVISGAGQIGTSATMYLINQTKGVINANGDASLTLRTDANIITNAGTIESTGTDVSNGGLVIWNTAVNNAGGTIQALGAQAHVDLQTAYIEGGILTSTGKGFVQTVDTGSTLDGITSGVLSNKGTVLVNDHTALRLVGIINNTGSIIEGATSVSGATNIRISGQTATLTGTGQFVMTDNANNQVFGDNSDYQLINQGNTISGAGQFGTGGMEFDNVSGNLKATGTNPLVVNLGTGHGVNESAGIFAASGAGGLILSGGIFTNKGTMNANDGSAITFQSGATNANLAEGDLVGGTWRATATGHGATLTLSGSAASGGPVITDGAILQLSGSGSIIQSFDTKTSTLKTLEQTMTNVASSGQLLILANRGYISTLDLSDSGTIQLGGGTFDVNSLTIGTGGLFFGLGTVKEAPSNAGKIEAKGGLLNVTGNITGAGVLQIDAASTLELGGSTSETATFNGVGTLDLDQPINFTGTIAGLILNDVIDLSGVTDVTKTGVTGSTLTVTRSGHPNLTYKVAGSGLAGNHFDFALDGSGGTNLTLAAGPGPAAVINPPPPGGPAGGGSGAKSGNFDPDWIGGSGTSFNTAANWNPSTVPSAGMDAVITLAGAAVVSSVSNTMATLAMGATDSLDITAGLFTVTDNTGVGGLKGNISVENGAALSLGGPIVNSGTISLLSTGVASQLRFSQTTNTLTGAGKIFLSADSHNQIFGTVASNVLDNVNNRITGSGELGDGQMTLINETAGLINANTPLVPLNVNTGGNTIINAGTMEATLGGDLNVLSPVNNTGGTILATGAGSVVFLASTVFGGTVTASSGGVIQTSGASGVLDGLGLHPVTNGSALQVINGQQLTLLGTVINKNSINLNSTGAATNLRIGSPTVTLQGTGAIHLSNNINNQIFGNNAAFQLINQTNKIDGAGQLGDAGLTFENDAVVDANQTTALVLNTSTNLMVNEGTMQSSNKGGLIIQNTAVNNSGGTIQALVAGSHVDLAGSTIMGGTLNTANGGVIRTVSGNGALDGITFGTLNNTGNLVVSDQTILSLSGIINNTGTIAESQLSNGGATRVRIASQNVSLTGGGKLTMTNNSLNVIEGPSASNTLTNVDNTISGAGQLGNGGMTLVNKTGGVINADQEPTFFQSGQLVISTGANTVVNDGLLEATDIGGLVIFNTAVNNSAGAETSGKILAAGTGAHVDLNGANIQGGILATSGGGVIQTVANSAIDGITYGTLNNTGTLLVNDLTRLDVAGTINNTGSILLDQESASGSTTLRLTSQNVVLQGGGKVVMSNNGLNQIVGQAGSDTLFNLNNTISGAGQIGTSATMVLVNGAAGIINADQSTALTVRTDANIITNDGTMEGTGTGGLVIWNTAMDNSSGTIQAVGAGSHVDLQSAYIEGGTLATSGGGVIQSIDNGTSALDGITLGVLNNKGTIQVLDGTRLGLVGTINNTGTISEAAFSKNLITGIRIIGNTTLQGGGSLVMSNNTNNQIFGTNSAFDLVNVDNTISGAGQIGTSATMSLINQAAGVINANQKASLTIRTDANIIINAGTMESTGTAALNGGLVIWNTAVNNSGGTIQALGAQAHVDLQSAYIEGGTLKTTGGGVIQTVDTGSTLDGITSGVLVNSGTVLVNDSMELSLNGTINNTGTILLNGFGNTGNTRLRLTGPTTLTGAGQLLLSDNPNNQVFSSDNLFTLTNNGNLISGAGQFGNGGMEFDNKSGSIKGTGTNALVINLGAGNGLNEAAGGIAANGSGGVILTSGIFTNNGTMTANNGSTFTFQSGAANTNLAEGDLVGGTWRAVASGLGATLSMTGGPIVTDAATIILSGDGSVIQAGTGAGVTPYQTLEDTLTTVASSGQLQLLLGRDYASTQNLSDSGIVQLNGGTFQTNFLSVTSGGQLFGFGTVQDAVSNAGTIEAKSGTLTVTGAISGAGLLQADAGATLSLTAAAPSQTGTVLDNGTVSLGIGSHLDVATVDPTSTGVFLLNNSSVLDVAVDKGTTNKMSFVGTGQLSIDAVSQFGNNVGLGTYTGPQLQNFGVGDVVQLRDLNFVGASIVGYTPGTGLLQIANGATKATLRFDNSTLPPSGSFVLNPDGGGHVLVTHT